MEQPIDRQTTLPVPLRRIEQAILVVRGQRVILSTDFAALYDVEPGALVQAVKRNGERFPEDFTFQLTPDEYRILKSQSVISNWGGRRHPPYAFTEQGVAMLSSVLPSSRAVQVNVEVIRAFVLRRILAENAGLARRLDELEVGSVVAETATGHWQLGTGNSRPQAAAILTFDICNPQPALHAGPHLRQSAVRLTATLHSGFWTIRLRGRAQPADALHWNCLA